MCRYYRNRITIGMRFISLSRKKQTRGPLFRFLNKPKYKKTEPMNNLLRGLIAGYGAKKLGGGCFGTIIVFIIIWMALGNC